jgi:hypothetical protein
LGRNLQGLAAIKTIVNDSILNDSILERRRKLATSRDLRGAQRNATHGRHQLGHSVHRGVFALAVQVDPSITPEGFDPAALISELRRD